MTCDYVAPRTYARAVEELVARTGARVLAGGTDVVLRQRQGQGAHPRALVDLKRIRGAASLKLDQRGALTLGPAVTMAQLEREPEVAARFAALAQGAALVGSPQIRNRATVVGNVCNAAPSADTAPGLIALRARARILGPDGRRSLPVERLMTGPGQNDLAPGELVTAITVPAPRPRSGSAYTRHTPRHSMDIAVAAAAAAVELAEDGQGIAAARICLGAVGPTPMRASRAEHCLRGAAIADDRLEEAADAAAGECRPISDVRAGAEFRRELIRVLVRRMLEAAITDARERASTEGRRA